MANHNEDLFRYELVTYGICYLDEDWGDTLAVSDGSFIGSPELAQRIELEVSPTSLVTLQYDRVSGEFVGAHYHSICALQWGYMNGVFPNPCSGKFFADLMSYCFEDVLSIVHSLPPEVRERESEMHATARRLFERIDIVPDCIIKRIRENNPYPREQVH